MITPEQEKWLSHLNDQNQIAISPYDPAVEKKFEYVKTQLTSVLGNEAEIVHKGATSLKISGQGKLDVYVPVFVKNFDETVERVENIYGSPGSLYPFERARFLTAVEGTRVEVFVINKETKGWIDSERFENYLRIHPDTLREYEKLKEDGQGLSTRQYYRGKIVFINDVLTRVAEESRQ